MYTAKVRLDHLRKWTVHNIALYHEKHIRELEDRKELTNKYNNKPWFIRIFSTDYGSNGFDWGWYKYWANFEKNRLKEIDNLIEYYYPPDTVIDYHFNNKKEHDNFFTVCKILDLKLN